MARPQKKIDFQYLKTICQRPISSEDIAAIMKVSKDTLERAIKKEYGIGFAAFKEENLAGLRLTILDQQIAIMKKGNASMAIWLGKQYCGQKDKTEITSDQSKPFTLAYTVDDLKKESDDQT